MKFQDIREAAEAQGFRVEKTKKSHWKFVPPDPIKPIVITAGTPSDHRAVKNALAHLRRSGLKWP